MSEISVHAGRSGYRWKQVVTWFKANVPWICMGCGGDIERDIDHQKDAYGYTLNHKIPKEVIIREKLDPELLYDHDNLEPMHRKCNSSRALDTEDRPVIVSRQW